MLALNISFQGTKCHILVLHGRCRRLVIADGGRTKRQTAERVVHILSSVCGLVFRQQNHVGVG